MKITRDILKQKYFIEGKSWTDIAKEYKVTHSAILYYVRKFNLKSRPRVNIGGWNKLNLINKKYGKLTVLKEAGRTKSGQVNWLCECKCGHKKVITTSSLRNKLTKSCGCIQAKHKKLNYGKIPGWYWINIEKHAINRKLEFSISIEYIDKIYTGICSLSGVNIVLNTAKKNTTASLDRIDSNLGYIEGNVQWVHKDINKLKGNWSDDKLIQWSKLIYLFQSTKEV